MKILISGNLGYIGPVLAKHLKSSTDGHQLMGYDLGIFAHISSSRGLSGDVFIDEQVFGDVRTIDPSIFKNIDAVVYLAAISNDPMGNTFEHPTYAVNYESAVRWAEMAKKNGVRNFVFASSCSVYGLADDQDRTETSAVNPLTAYARSKVQAEVDLKKLADQNFQVSCLRFATACGWSDRLRLDLVLNDFVAGALVNKKIEILSDGSPWRPLIHVEDMARAIDWALHRADFIEKPYLIVNIGANEWNLQVKDLALEVQKILPDISIDIAPNGQPDKRSYRVDFGLFKALAPAYQPLHTPATTIKSLINGLSALNFNDPHYRSGHFIRLNVLKYLIDTNQIDSALNRSR